MPFVNQEVVPKTKALRRYVPSSESCSDHFRDEHTSRPNSSAAPGRYATAAKSCFTPQRDDHSIDIDESSRFGWEARRQQRTGVSSRVTRQSSEDNFQVGEPSNSMQQPVIFDRHRDREDVRFIPKAKVATTQSFASNKNVRVAPCSSNTISERKIRNSNSYVSSNMQASSNYIVRRSVIGALAINDNSQVVEESLVTVCGLVIAKGTPRSFRLVSESGIVLRHLLAFTVRDSPTDFVNVFCWASLEFLARLTSSFHINDVIELQAASVQPRNASASSNGRAVRTSSRFELIFRDKRSSLIVHPPQSAEVVRLKYLVHLPLPAMVIGFDEKTCTQLARTRSHSDSHSNHSSDLTTCACFTANACLRCLSRFALSHMVTVPSEKAHLGGPTTVLTNISALTVVESVGKKYEVTTKKEERLWLVNARLLDTTCRMFRIALWGEEMCRIAESWVPMNTVISIRDCVLQYDQFSGPSLTSGAATVITSDPELSAATELQQFALSVNLVSQSNGSTGNQFIPGIVKVSSVASLNQLFAVSQPTTACMAKKWEAPTEHFIVYAVVTRCNVNEGDLGTGEDHANQLELEDYQPPFKIPNSDSACTQRTMTGSAKRPENAGSKSGGSLISMRCCECSQIERFCRCRYKREKRAAMAAKNSVDFIDNMDDDFMTGLNTQRLSSRICEGQAAEAIPERSSEHNSKSPTQSDCTFIKQFDLCLHLTDHTGTLPYVRVHDQQLIGRILQCASVEEFLKMNAEQRAVCRSRLLLERFRFTLKMNMFVAGCLKPKIEIVDIRCIDNSGAAEFVRFILAE